MFSRIELVYKFSFHFEKLVFQHERIIIDFILSQVFYATWNLCAIYRFDSIEIEMRSSFL